MTSSDPSYSFWYVFYKATNLPEWGFLDDSSSYYFSFLGQEDHDHFRKLNFASIFISVSLLWIKLVIRSRIKNQKRSFLWAGYNKVIYMLREIYLQKHIGNLFR